MTDRSFCVTVLLIALAACSSGDPAAPSAAQNQDLESAARMLDEAPNGLGDIDDSKLLADQHEADPAEERASGR